MALNSYFDFAENDFQYFKDSYDAGIVANMMGAMAQGICEKYMKHLISEYYKPDDAMQQKDFENILRTHSLNRLNDAIELCRKEVLKLGQKLKKDEV